MTDDLLRELAKDLPYERPSAARRDALRSSLLVEATESTEARPVVTRRWPIVAGFVAGALAAAAVALLVLQRPAPVPLRQQLAQVTASSPEVRVDHEIVATETGTDEVVRFREGTLALAIPAQRRGDRTLVRTATADVIAEAGELEVTIAHEQLQAVTVKAGAARIVVVGQTPVILSAGQTWRASVITADLTPSTPPPASPSTIAATPPATSTTALPAPTTPPTTRAPASVAVTTSGTSRATDARPPAPVEAPASPANPPATSIAIAPPVPAPPPSPPSIEQRFQKGWALLREGKAQQAADELGAAADASPASPLAADARYFQAVALVRANDPRAAERVLVQFLDTAPTSLRRGRAAVLLGRLLAERGDPKTARAWLEIAAADPDPSIAAAAKVGLQALPR